MVAITDLRQSPAGLRWPSVFSCLMKPLSCLLSLQCAGVLGEGFWAQQHQSLPEGLCHQDTVKGREVQPAQSDPRGCHHLGQ